MAEIKYVTEASFRQDVELSSTPVLVDFYADWCGPCKMLSPILEKFANEHPEVKVVKVMKFGAFVELWPGYEGLVHISQLAQERVAKVEDVVREGDEIVVKVMGFDEKGKVLLSRKEVLAPKATEEKEVKEETQKEE